MKTQIKKVLKKNFASLAYFYSYLKLRIVVLLVISIFVGLMDGLGLSMFLPMLEIVANENSTATAEQMGNLAFVLNFINTLGFSLTLEVVLVTIFIFFFLKGIFKWLEQFLFVIYHQYFIRKIRVENMDNLAHYRYDAFVTSDAGKIQNSMSGEVGRVVQAYKSYSQMLQQGVMVITYTFLAFLANPEFAGLVAVGGILTNFLFNSLYKKTKELSGKLVKSSHGFQGLLIQQVAHFKYLKATGLIHNYTSKLKEKIIEIEKTNKQIGVLSSVIQGIREPLMIGVVIGVILIQIKLMGGNLSTIILSILFFYRGLTSVMHLQTLYNNFLSFSGSLENMQEFTTELKSGAELSGEIKIDQFKYALELFDVSFFYNSVEVIKNISFKFYRNQTIALVGESGSGKTTLMNIMSGILQPTRGKMYIDNIDSYNLNMSSLQKRVGYITQEPVIFDDTIFNNVTFWALKTEENLNKFWVALQKASIKEFFKDKITAENTRLGNNGINLSGGQKQRVSIARELYKDIDFLFMDEATSALDSETEKIIQNNIDNLKGHYSILIIAHRLSTIKNADKVVVLKNGQIDRIGTYNELMTESDSFKRMVSLQEL